MAESCTKYRMYRKQRKVSGTNDWEDVIPYQYSIDGDGTQPFIELEVASADCCGQDPDTGDTPSVGDIKWEVVSNNYYCTGTTKVEMLQKYQWNGTQWMPLEEYQMGNVIEYNSTDCGYIPQPHDYSQDYLTLKILSSGTLVWKSYTNLTTSTYSPYIGYSLDNGETWGVMDSYVTPPSSVYPKTGTTINVNAGDVVLLRASTGYIPATGRTYAQWYGQTGSGGHMFAYASFSGSTAHFDIEGNIMSIVYDEASFRTATTFPYDEEEYYSGSRPVPFYRLFNNTHVHNAENLVLPATGVLPFTYAYMFAGCENMTKSPKILPISEFYGYLRISNACLYMFSHCTSLTTAPELPAMTLAQYSYEGMFAFCTSLTKAPELPATYVSEHSYYSMFQGCTSLTIPPPELPDADANINVKALAYANMFSGCTSLRYSPIMASNGHRSEKMYSGCRNLRTITCLGDIIGGSNWVQDVAVTGVFYKDPLLTSWSTGNSGIPSGWIVLDYTP